MIRLWGGPFDGFAMLDNGAVVETCAAGWREPAGGYPYLWEHHPEDGSLRLLDTRNQTAVYRDSGTADKWDYMPPSAVQS